MYNGTQLTESEIKELEIDILSEIDSICRKNDIRYSLIAGTLLGAVRHKGFIPWDDDIDIAMLRSDYSRFILYCSKHITTFELKCIETDEKYHYLFAKACNKETIVIEKIGNRTNCQYGIFVDIFPVDYVGDTLQEAKRNVDKMRFNRSLIVAYNWKSFYRNPNNPIWKELIKYFFYLISRFIDISRVENTVENYYIDLSNKKRNYVADAVDNGYHYKAICAASLYDNYIELPFEGCIFLAIKDYSQWLKQVYGEYMSLPPEDNRKTHHSFNVFWRYK